MTHACDTGIPFQPFHEYQSISIYALFEFDHLLLFFFLWNFDAGSIFDIHNCTIQSAMKYLVKHVLPYRTCHINSVSWKHKEYCVD